MPEFGVAIYSSIEAGRQRLTPADYRVNSERTDLRWGTGIVGGYGGLQLGMSDGLLPAVGTLPTLQDIPMRAHVVVTYGSQVVYEGRRSEVERGAGGLARGVSAEGYVASLNDNWSRNQSTTTVSSGEALEAVLAAVAPHVRVGNVEQWMDPLVMHTETPVEAEPALYVNTGGMSDFYKLTGGEAVDLVTKEGNADSQPVDFMLWDGITAWLLPRVAPERPHYRCAFDHARMSWRESEREMASHVTVEYQVLIGPDTVTETTEAETAGFLDTYGFTRHVLIPAGQMTPDAAQALRDTELTRRSRPTVQCTIQITDDPSTWLLRGNAPWPYWLMRSGEWVQVADQPMQPIVQMTVDASGHSATIELGSYNDRMPRNTLIREKQIINRLARALGPNGGRAR